MIILGLDFMRQSFAYRVFAQSLFLQLAIFGKIISPVGADILNVDWGDLAPSDTSTY